MVLPLGSRGSGGFASAFSTVGLELFSLLPNAAAARGLSIAAAAQDRTSFEPIRQDRDIEVAARQAEQQAKDLGRIKTKLDKVDRLVERARDKLDEIRLLLVDMRKAVELSQLSHGPAPPVLRAVFDKVHELPTFTWHAHPTVATRLVISGSAVPGLFHFDQRAC